MTCYVGALGCCTARPCARSSAVPMMFLQLLLSGVWLRTVGRKSELHCLVVTCGIAISPLLPMLAACCGAHRRLASEVCDASDYISSGHPPGLDYEVLGDPSGSTPLLLLLSQLWLLQAPVRVCVIWTVSAVQALLLLLITAAPLWGQRRLTADVIASWLVMNVALLLQVACSPSL